MIIVISKFRTRPGCRDKVVSLSRPCAEATRNEDGCISYELTASSDDDVTLVFVERWRDKAALASHLRSEHLNRFREDRALFAEGTGDLSLYGATPVQL
ncbi:MAG: antibiotic biosynthesis monooxygenase [Synergistaceae bacterium]|nr:antibiotic biosynthesis monooxygenase [Synergistaceae bacterium]